MIHVTGHDSTSALVKGTISCSDSGSVTARLTDSSAAAVESSEEDGAAVVSNCTGDEVVDALLSSSGFT